MPSASGKGAITLPRELFASAEEDERGLIAVSEPEPGFSLDVDPEIMRALNEDEGFEALQDDFIVVVT